MKKLILLPLLFILSFSASAQWVTIPDANFANKLNELFPECMDGNQIDTTCPGITSATSLNVLQSNISSLSGIEYFTSLQSLNCYDNDINALPNLPATLLELSCNKNNIDELPNLPNSLTFLHCRNNNLTELPPLPGSLTYLHCGDNNLTVLPDLPSSLTELVCFDNEITNLTDLPVSLVHLDCTDNALSVLPELPNSLTYLGCSDNILTSLPVLPASLTEFWCRLNSITSLPALPNSLMILHCNNNNLTELPELPASLIQLICNNNNLPELPVLPSSLARLYCYTTGLNQLPELPSSLTELKCYNNNLTSLPELPQSLEELQCSSNLLTSLPELPNGLEDLNCGNNNLNTLPELPQSLEKLRCANNQLTCLPTLPMSLNNNSASFGFNISGNLFTCLPNYVPAMSGTGNSQWLSYPLCDLSDLDDNPYGCSSLDGIAGVVFHDEDGNCESGEMESGIVNAPVKLLSNEDELLATTYTFSNSFYNLMADTGAYTVQLVTENMPFQISCDDPGNTQEVLLTADEPSALNVDFGMECPPGFDIGVQSVASIGWVFPGQVHTLKIAAGDLSSWYGMSCAEGVGGTLNVNLSGPFSYVGPAAGAFTPTVTGDLQFTFDIADFSAVDMQQDFQLLLLTDSTAQEDDQVCVEVLVDPSEGDFNPENNTHSHCYEVVNSYDPNIKQVWPQNVEPGYEGYFNYTIYFQNTGTAPAFNIRVADTLDTNLDLNTFEVTAYSHECLTYVSGNVATFRFNDIMLPDSTTDFDGSIGYVQYRIKPIADLPVGTVIENTAHIYFDFNDAIVTNTTQNEYVIDTSIDHAQKQIAMVFPNPGSGQFNVLFGGVETGITTHLEVYNLNGQRVLQQQVNESRVVLDLTGYPSGMYLLHVRNENGSEAVKLMKH